jgi:hypothetical protein
MALDEKTILRWILKQCDKLFKRQLRIYIIGEPLQSIMGISGYTG